MRRSLLTVAAAIAVIVPIAFVGPSAPGTTGTLQAPFVSLAAPTGTGATQLGFFTQPFAEPGPSCPHETEGSSSNKTTAKPPHCKPAAVSVVVMPNGKILYWDGLENMESNQHSVTLEFGDLATNDQSRVMNLHGAWQVPSPSDSGANAKGYKSTYLVPDPPPQLKPFLNDKGQAQGALFCASQVILKNGDVLVAGGTDYYAEPRVAGTPYGVAELEGLRNSRLFLPASNKWVQSGYMHYGRWYPTILTLPNGNVFVASGVTKLIKPAYPNRLQDSGRNVTQTETYDLATGKWTYNGASADKSLPLFPRLHLLPDGKILFDANGQTFNPFGQAYDEASWNNASVYDPKAKTWTDVGTPAFGFQGSTFSVMLPLQAPYTKASFLTAGGVLGVTPGTYLATPLSRIDTVDTAHGDAFTSTPTGMLNNSRWYSTAVVLPTGQVIAFSGADRDEVDFPGTGFPVHQAEMFDPATGAWTPLASGHDDRTYHNTAVLLPDGRILVGGHSPISTMYGNSSTIPGGFSNNFRDPSFEIYTPPYLLWGPRPSITGAPSSIGYGRTFTIHTPHAADIASVALVRNPALTHIVDGDQRVIDLQIVSRTASTLTVTEPPSGNVAPPGPYMLFVNAKSAKGLIPSVSAQLFVGAPMPAWARGG